MLSALFLLHACSLSDGDTPYASASAEGDSGADSGSADTDTDTDDVVDADPSAWTDPAYWDAPGPLSSLILPETVDASPHWEVRIAVSPDGATWVADDRVVMQGMSGLSMAAMADRIILTGNVDAGQAAAHDITLDNGSIYAISSFDLTTWTSTAWPVTAATRAHVVDPMLAYDLNGAPRAVWFGSDQLTGNPADFPGFHELYLGSWDGTGFAEDLQAWTAETLTDPAMCRLDDQLWLFATNEASTILTLNAGIDGAWELIEDRTWEGAVSPSCIEQEGSIGLIASVDGAPKIRDLYSDATLAHVDQLVPAALFGSECVSPTLAAYGTGWVFACSIWVD